MAGVILRTPAVGIVAGLLFGCLGVLLLGIEGQQGPARLLFPVSGAFFLTVGILSVLSAVFVIIRSRRS
jgi:hypothetical protein